MFDGSTYIDAEQLGPVTGAQQSPVPDPKTPTDDRPLQRYVIPIHRMHGMNDPVAGVVVYATGLGEATDRVTQKLRQGDRVLLEGGRIAELPAGQFTRVNCGWARITQRDSPTHDQPWVQTSPFNQNAAAVKWPTVRKPTDPDYPPPDFLPRAAPETIAELYAGRRYEDVRLKPASKPPQWCPHRYDLVGGAGSSLGGT